MTSRILACAIVLLAFSAGCTGTTESKPEERPHIEGTRGDLKILRLEGIRDPDSPAGQQRLWKLKGDRDALEKILKEAENANMR